MQDAIIMYENGKAIGGEGHPTNASDITFDNTGTDLVSENVENAIKEVNAKTSGLTRMTKLWENPSPTASFSAQNITLASADYDFLLWQFAYSTSYIGSIISSPFVEKGKTCYCNIVSFTENVFRQCDYVNDTTYTIHNTSYNNNTNNNYAIPLVVYGIKLI